MKKKYLVFPIVTLSLSVIATLIMLVFTTSFAYDIGYNYQFLTNNIIEINRAYRIMEKAYEIEPSYSNYEKMNELYDIQNVLAYSKIYNVSIEESLARFPSDYLEKNEKWTRTRMERLENEDDGIRRFEALSGGAFRTAIFAGPNTARDCYNKFNSAIVLYLNGKKEESKVLVEKTIDEYDNDTSFPYYSLLYDYVYTVHQLETDKDFQIWMVNYEEELTQRLKEKNPNTTVEKNMFLELFSDNYKPFE